jgi:hypothetical protein
MERNENGDRRSAESRHGCGPDGELDVTRRLRVRGSAQAA